MYQVDKEDTVAELAGQLRTHLEFLGELGIESASDFVALNKVPKSSANLQFAKPDMPTGGPPPVKLRAPPPTATKPLGAAGLADLPRLGAPRSTPRPNSAALMDRTPPNWEPAPSKNRPLMQMISEDHFSDSLPDSEETLAGIHESIGNCLLCPLSAGRTHIVHTEGNLRARLMFVGEAPGADEDTQARPFVGRAGQLLGKIIEAIGFRRDEVLIGNINRCRPPGNRPPTPDEVAACKPFLLREIGAVRPEVIVVLGNTAMKNLLGIKEGITKVRGTFQDFYGIKVMPTFHPAYLLRDPSKKRETWADLKKVRDYLVLKQP